MFDDIFIVRIFNDEFGALAVVRVIDVVRGGDGRHSQTCAKAGIGSVAALSVGARLAALSWN